MKYKMAWSKAYYINGTTEIEANSQVDAIRKMDTIIGDQEGPMQYYPDDNTIEIEE